MASSRLPNPPGRTVAATATENIRPDAAAIIAQDYVIVLIANAVIRLCRCEMGIVDLFENVDVPALGA